MKVLDWQLGIGTISDDGGYVCNSTGIINTGVNLEGNYIIETKIKMDSFQSSYNNIWGTGSTSYESWVPNSGKTLCFRSNGTRLESSKTMVTGQIYTIKEEFNNGMLTADVKTGEGVFENWISSTGSTGTSSTVKLFATTSNTCATNMTMYYFKIYKDGQLVLDLIPVHKGETKDGKIMKTNGLYDTISKTLKK